MHWRSLPISSDDVQNTHITALRSRKSGVSFNQPSICKIGRDYMQLCRLLQVSPMMIQNQYFQ